MSAVGSLITTPVLADASMNPGQITVFLLALAALLGLARIFGEVAKALRQPAVFGEILAGILLGPTVFGAISPDGFAWLFPTAGPTRVALDGFVTLSVSLLLFIVGLDVDLSSVFRQGKTAFSVSASGIVLPFTTGFILAWFAPGFFGMAKPGLHLPFALLFGIALSITALPVIAKILMDINLAKSDMGMLVLSSAMLDDLVGWFGFAIVLALMPRVGSGAESGTAGMGVGATIATTIGFLIVMLTLGRYLTHRILPYIQAHWTWPGGVIAFVFVFALVCAAFTEFLGIHSIFGAFVAGVTIGDSHHLTERTRDTIHQFVANIFAPIFLAAIGLRIDFVSAFSLPLVLICFFVAATGKILGCFAGARLARMSPRESWALAFGMAAQGAVGIILGQLAHQAGLITDQLFVAIIITALATSLMAGPLMQRILRMRTQKPLSSFLSDRGILIAPNPAHAEALIHEMATHAGQITGLATEEIEQAVLRRERIMHTGLPNGLAVPHARLDNLSKPYALLACLARGVDFHSPDSQPARIVCLILTPTDNPDAQIELLNLFARTFDSAKTREEALNAQTTTELLAALNRATDPSGQPPTPPAPPGSSMPPTTVLA